jgi:hypothetical protein
MPSAGAGAKDKELSDSLLGQDHYAVLNLSHLRWRATEEDIRRACARHAALQQRDARHAAWQRDGRRVA